jgi:hypothetical protein
MHPVAATAIAQVHQCVACLLSYASGQWIAVAALSVHSGCHVKQRVADALFQLVLTVPLQCHHTQIKAGHKRLLQLCPSHNSLENLQHGAQRVEGSA